MTLRDWLDMLGSYWRSIAAATLAGALLGVLASVLTPASYTASGQLVLSVAGTTDDTGQDIAYAGQYIQNRMPTYRQLARSKDVLDKAGEPLGLTAVNLLPVVDATSTADTTVLTVSASDGSAKRAAQIASAVSVAVADAIKDLDGAGSTGSDDALVRITEITEPSPPTAASSPSYPTNVIAGGIIGFLVGLAAALFRHLLRRPRTRTAA